MDVETFRTWLEAHRQAWEARDPQAAASIFAADATYRETRSGARNQLR
jgi:hypothetical protein